MQHWQHLVFKVVAVQCRAGCLKRCLRVCCARAVVPCSMGLACLPLQAGGSAGSGVGYCTKLGLGGNAPNGAAALPVTRRKTTSGKDCRLPIVYK